MWLESILFASDETLTSFTNERISKDMPASLPLRFIIYSDCTTNILPWNINTYVVFKRLNLWLLQAQHGTCECLENYKVKQSSFNVNGQVLHVPVMPLSSTAVVFPGTVWVHRWPEWMWSPVYMQPLCPRGKIPTHTYVDKGSVKIQDRIGP